MNSTNSMDIHIDGHETLGSTYKHWRNLLLRANLLCTLVILVTEIIMFFVFRAGGLFLHTVPVYLFRFLILPTIIDGLIVLGGWAAMRRLSEQSWLLNYVPIVQLTLLCCVVSTIHHVFAATFCTYCCPIFITVIFNDRKMTLRITALSILCLSLSQLLGPGINGVISRYFLPEFFVALMVLLAASIICSVLSRFLQDRNDTIQSIYRKQMETLEQLNLDQKTGLYGSTAFMNRLEQIVSSAEGKSRLGLAVIDIDDFKHVNDTHGHAKGDEVIVSLACLMKKLCGKRYLPVRFGGEEFAVVFTNGTPQDYFDFTDTLREDFSRIKHSFTDERITLSAGLAIWESGLSCNDLFDHADKAMYKAKSCGKNRTCFFDSATTAQIHLPEKS